jgi:uncharacterized phage protein (TIGR02218 family)
VAYQDDEASQQDGRPIELYEFVGTVKTYRYTNFQRRVQFNSEWYYPVTLKRSALKVGTSQEKGTITIELPVDAEVIWDYGFDVPPPDLSVTVYRQHGEGNEAIQYWYGQVGSILLAGRTAKLKVPSTFDLQLSLIIPAIAVQAQCNHATYDERCGAVRTSFDVATTIDTITNSVTIAVVSDGGNPDQWFRGGEIVTASGERRLVVDHQGNTLLLNFPFLSLSVGDAVTLFAGDDHTFATCHAKFDRSIAFSGFNWMPVENPFATGL